MLLLGVMVLLRSHGLVILFVQVLGASIRADDVLYNAATPGFGFAAQMLLLLLEGPFVD